MTLYTRPQLAVVLLVVLVAGLGLGIGHWRRAHPEIVERIESFDRVPVVATAPPEPPVRRVVAPKATPSAHPIDVNRASEEELRTLPGVGAVLAARIVEARERDGPFA